MQPTEQTSKQPGPPPELEADEIFANGTSQKRESYCSEDTGQIYIKRLSAPEVSSFWDSLERDPAGTLVDPYSDPKLIVAAVVDSKGQPKFNSGHLTKLAALAHNVIMPLVDAILVYNAMSPAGVEAVRKNSKATPGPDSA
jgi:hypothetical protein